MQNRVTLCENVLDPTTWETRECDDIRRFLVDHFGQWPQTAKIYLNRVGKDTDVTPYDEGGIERLGILHGHFFVVVYPEELGTIVLIVSIALSAASLVIGYLLRPSLPANQEAGSPTNSLSARNNKERINERIPDIYGTLWVTPDLIGVPYRTFIGNKEVEYSFMCIGRGEYDIVQVRDDVTPIEQINGAGCEIYAPNTSPNSGDAAQVSYGEPINELIRNVKQYSSVNGQTLKAPNANKFKASKNVRFTDSGIVEGSGDIDFTDYFDAGTEANPKYLVIGNSDYNGTYLILDVNTTQIVLSDPGSVNAAWSAISGATAYASPTLLNSGDNFEGPFFIVDNEVTELWCNFVAQQGLYEIDSDGNQHAMAVTVQIEVTSIDNNYNAQGSPIYYQTTLKGSEVLRTQCGATLVVHLPIAGSCKVRARRLTNTDLRDGWNVVDQVQWRDLYGVSPLEETDFGNVTTLQTITWPTPQALAIKQRKINVLIGRKIATYLPSIEEHLPSLGLGGLCGAFCNDAGIVIEPFEIGLGGTFKVPFGATKLQLGINDYSYADNDDWPSAPFGGFNVEVAKGSSNWSGFITPKVMPWSVTANPSFDYGANDGDAPIVVPIALIFNDTVVITTAGGTVKCGYGYPRVGPAGDLVPALPTGGSTMAGYYFPTKYMMHGAIAGGMSSFSIVSKNAADILIHMALDPYIGRRQISELDVETIQSVLGAAGEVETYFGTDLCNQFCYAFDDSKMSFEEMAAILGQATFCMVFRRGNVLSVFFEKETDDSTILFNHRNKLPGSETRTVKFGTASENDGIDLDYIEPNAPNAQNIDSVVTLRFPEDGSAVAPKKIKATGVRNRVQAWMLGWRLYQKLLYQNQATQFDATSEAGLCIASERILVADNTRSDTQDGEVLDQDGLELTLSQPVTFSEESPSPGYTIFLQHYDATVEAIPIIAGSEANKVILSDAPSMALVTDETKYAKTTYVIVSDADQAASAFLLQEKDAKDGGQYGIKAVNYDNRYYEHDQDYAASPRIIDVIAPGDGTGSGYSAQASSSVFVDAKTMPWISPDNAGYAYGQNDGKPPVMIPIQTDAGGEVAIAASAPGQAIDWIVAWITHTSSQPTNTVRRSDEVDPVDAEGEQDHITADASDSHGYFPTHYTTDKSLGRCGLIGCWALKDTPTAGKYQVVAPFVVGFGGNFTVPAGGVDTLLLGINDNKFSDNRGGFQVQVTQTGAAAGAAAAADPVPDNTTANPNAEVWDFTVNGA